MPEGAARRNLVPPTHIDKNLWQGAVNGMYFLPLTAKGAVFVVSGTHFRPQTTV